MRKENEARDIARTTIYSRISAILIICTIVFLVFNTLLYVQTQKCEKKCYELSLAATQFMDASAYLTSEARAYAATGDREHRENYWSEVHTKQNRDKGVAKMRQLGITEEEEKMVERMFDISNKLIENEELDAIKLAQAGNIEGAMAIVYGEVYNAKIAEIRALKEQFRAALYERTQKELNDITLKFNIINIITWIMALSVIVMQIVQKRVLYRLAYVDQLTRSYNYYTFRQKMHKGINIRKQGYVVAVDLKNFSIINDVCGIEKGDEVIKEISSICKTSLLPGEEEMLAHISGDRFVMLMQSDDDDALVRRLSAMRSKITALSAKMEVPYLMPMFGVQRIADTSQPELSYGSASFANRQLKNSGNNSFYLFFDQEMANTILENRRKEKNFEDALKKHRFEVWYQPKYMASSDVCAAGEALVRWRKEDGGLVPPLEFIPLFEQNGMIAQLDEYVFNAVCAKQKEWRDSGIEVLPISVNVSRASLLRSDIVERYVNILKRYDVPANTIILELTESAMSGNENTKDILMRFREAGLKVLVDDFGIGYSSLSTLVYGCFDGIKLDKSLIDNIEDPTGEHLVEIITDLAHEFNMQVTAEGAETAEQVALIKKLSCDMIQGYYYSRPLTEKEFVKLLKHINERG